MTREEKITWLAGLLEGEGCFSPERCAYWYTRGKKSKRKTVGYYFRITINMADRDVIERAIQYVDELIGYRVNLNDKPPTNPNYQHQYRAYWYGLRAAMLASLILPFMGKRRESAIIEAIEKCK
jgi:hypothetical protein